MTCCKGPSVDKCYLPYIWYLSQRKRKKDSNFIELFHKCRFQSNSLFPRFICGWYLLGKKKENKKEKKGESEWGVKRVKGCIFSFTVNIKVVPKLKYHKKCSNSCRSILIAFYVDFSFKIETPWSQLYSRQNVFKKKVN